MPNKQNHMTSLCARMGILFLFLLCSFNLGAQETKEVEKVEGANAVREEIQRYMGYEPVLPRYLTLPYDATTNSNVQNAFVDIGYLFLALIPVLFLFGFKSRPLYGFICMAMLLLVLYISIGSGKIFVQNQFVDTTEFASKYDGKGLTSFPSNIVNPIYEWVGQSYGGINSFFINNSGNADSFTYPIIFLLFLFIIFLVRQRTLDQKKNKRILILFVSFFTFMWMLLTAGIIWYGYPMIALSILLILSSIEPKKEEQTLDKKLVRIIGLTAVAAFVMISTVYRFSNYKMNLNDAMAKQLFDVGELKYQSGRQDKKQVLDGFFQGGINKVLEKINNDEEALVYRVGTVLPFFVKKNDSRVFMDNQLQNFEKLRVYYKDKNTLIEVLKSAGFKYIFVDLMTYSIDKTPERTLENKYKEFMRVLYKNPKVELLATNRRINTSQDPQKPKPGYGVFGAPLPNFHGNYAIFELMD